jgi:hypothetical protein
MVNFVNGDSAQDVADAVQASWDAIKEEQVDNSTAGTLLLTGA